MKTKTRGYKKMSGCEFVRDSLRLYVTRRDLREGDRLPSEIALAKEFGVSRTVLRETYRLLERDGYIVVKGGAGTFLAENHSMVKTALNVLSGTGALIREAGFEAGSEIMGVERRPIGREWGNALGVDENEPAIVMRRARKADGIVIALAWNAFPERLVGDSFENGIAGDSIFQHLETKRGIRIASALASVRALRTDDPRDDLAKEILGESALLLKRSHFDDKGSPVFHSLDYIRTDLVELTIRQERDIYR
ncbi:MAG: GntR family transcriptional regulator [Deltaproteobacteria bacterium]|jgi:GntR family transcriptional regulator|nr:GntR family transcriptional regulator [Deltaproteobacteria bacterium]